MELSTMALVLGSAALLGGAPRPSEAAQGQRDKTALSARIEVDAHERSFTVRFYLKNTGKDDQQVVYGHGGSGLAVVPQFQAGDVTINPPTYLRPPRRAMAPNGRTIPAGKEVLYGTFTMGYPPAGRKREVTLSGTIYFRELKATVRTEATTLKLPAAERDR